MLRIWIVTLGLAGFSCASAWAQTTTRMSVNSAGVEGNSSSVHASISAGGRFVAFSSPSTNLVAGDTNSFYDVFVHDRATGATTRANVNSAGMQANGAGLNPSISGDGRFVAFFSSASSLVPGDTNGAPDIFVHDMQTGLTTRVSVDSSGAQSSVEFGTDPAISADGRFVAFHCAASNLVTGDTNGVSDVFLHDRQTGATTRVSVDSSGAQSDMGSTFPSISRDGRYVAFRSDATNLVLGDTNVAADVFVHDNLTGVTELVSVDSGGAQGNDNSFNASVSDDGRYVAFASWASNLVPGDTNASRDSFVHDRLTGLTTRISVDSSGAQGNSTSDDTKISADGRFIAFMSDATNLVPGDTNGFYDLFLHDRLTGTTTRVSVSSGGGQGSSTAMYPTISADGRAVAFESFSPQLVPGDTNGTVDVFVHETSSAFIAFCPGDGSGPACPCANNGNAGHGCENSATTGGALLAGSGDASLSADTVVLTSSSELATALSIVLQGGNFIASVAFGDGLRCAGGALKRLYSKHAAGGVVSAPELGDLSISARSAALGDAIPFGASRYYQVYYRDPNLVFCPGGFNVSNAVAVAWGY